MTATNIQRLVTIFLFSIVTTQVGHAQAFPWRVQVELNVKQGSISFNKIDAPHGDTLHVMALGFGGDNNCVSRTTDGGTTWDIPLQRLNLEEKINDLSHPTPECAVIVGDTIFSDTGSMVFFTHDGGDSWQQGWCDSCKLTNGERYHLTHVSMSDSLNGIVCGGLSCIARTTDGGRIWRRISDPTNGQELFYSLRCISPSTYLLKTSVFLSGISTLYRTTDSGATWTRNPLPKRTNFFDFLNSMQGWAVSSGRDSASGNLLYNAIVRTTNGGITWDTVFDAPSLSIRDDGADYISMADSDNGIAVGGGGNWFYTINGSPWQEGPNLDSIFQVYNLTSVTYPHPNKAWATDVSGRILVYERRTASAPIVPGNSATAATIETYPNPIAGGMPISISINLPNSDHARLYMDDVRGVTVATIERPITGSNRFVWSPPATLPSGIYFLRLVAGTSVATYPVTIVR